ncbi:phosphoribosyltransferase family protein [Orrella sp. JC864]|uniref:ComF family protein n=1 Tax=Orrella sp. JC864 TaxID=3120298 RepID=UPI0012BC89BF
MAHDPQCAGSRPCGAPARPGSDPPRRPPQLCGPHAPPWRRALAQGLRQGAAFLRACLATDCPLCRGAARGARLCGECARDASASLEGMRRCPRCDLPAFAAMRTGAAAGPQAQAGPAGCGCPLAQAPFEALVSGFEYRPPADQLVLRLKNRLQLSAAGALAGLLARRVRQAPWAAQPDWWLVPVPASRASLLRRGFNPAAEIARRLSGELHWPVRGAWLRRVREPRAKQTRLGRRQRQLAARDAYRAAPAVRGRKVALVDDVVTTGATAVAAAQALREAGAARVVVLAAARTPAPGGPADLAK